jgi:hypothetical protein
MSGDIPPLPQYAFMALCIVTQKDFTVYLYTHTHTHTREYPKVSGLAAWSEYCKWFSSLPLDAVISLFCESVY